MKNYIEREAACELLAMALDDDWEPEYAADRMNNIPTADVKPVVRGEWRICDDYTSISKNRHRETRVITWMCSECYAKNGRKKTNFCPNCGADMRGDD